MTSNNNELDKLIAEYLAAVDRGEMPDREQFAADKPNFAEQLQAFFDDLDDLEQQKQAAVDQETVIGQEGSAADAVVIKGYKILQPIAAGGMGQVYMAEQTEPVKRRVALKVIKTDTPTKEILARFEAERQALAMMDHLNIAKVLDAGVTTDGRPYFAMELVKGIPITEYCDRNKLNPNERLDLFVQTCRAIQHAHMKGIVHRDIKPSNVLVTLYDGKPVAKVIDFGLAKALQNTTQLTERTLFTQYGQVVGTLAYMSPEQAEMNALDVDTRTDVYSLGVILYELLTGSTPITRERIRTEAFDRILALIREEEATRPSQRLSDSGEAITGISDQRKTEPKRLSVILKGDLDWIAVKALEKDRTRRYDTPAALADDVQRYLSDEAIEARPPSLGYRVQKAYRRNRAGFFASATIIGLLLVVLVGTGTMWWRASRAENEARTEAANALKAENNERLAREDAEATVARSNYFLALARWDANRVAEAHEFLDKVPTEHRNIEWYLAKKRFRGSDITCYGHWASVNSVSFSPDGKLVASASNDRSIRIWDASTGKQLKMWIGHDKPIVSIAFSPDGTQLASAASDGEMKLWNWDSGSEIWTADSGLDAWPADTRQHVESSLAFSPDGKRIVSGATRSGNGLLSSENTSIKLWSASDGKLLQTCNAHVLDVSCVAFSPDGKLIASASTVSSQINIWNSSNGEESKTIRTPYPSHVAFSPNGASFACDNADGEIRLLDLVTGKELQSMTGQGEILDLAFSPDGMRVASAGSDRTIKLWDVATGNEIITLKGHAQQINSLKFSADGTQIASGSGSPQGDVEWGVMDNTIKIWDVATGHRHVTRPLSVNVVNCVAFSPDGMQIGIGSNANRLLIFDIETHDIRSMNGHTSSIESVAFSPDGTSCVTGSKDHTIRLWNMAEEHEQITQTGSTRVNCVCYSPNGSLVASAAGSILLQGYSEFFEELAKDDPTHDTTIELWNGRTGEPIRTLRGHTNSVNSLCFNSDGKRIASGCNEEIRIWDTTTGVTLRTIPADVDSLCFSPDGTRIASAGRDETITIRDTSSGESIIILTGHAGDIECIDFSPDGTRIISASSDGTVKLWDAINGQELLTLLTLDASTGSVYSVDFSPDGTQIVAGGTDAKLSLWNISKDEVVEKLKGHTSLVTSLCVSPDGTQIASGGFDNSLKLWNASTGEEIRSFTGNTNAVVAVQFSEDGTKLYSKSYESETLVWDLSSGETITESEPRRLSKPKNITVDGFLAVPAGNSIQLVDTRLRDIPREKHYRVLKTESQPWWHFEQLELARESKNTFAEVFHVAWLFNIYKERIQHISLYVAYKNLSSDQQKVVPPIVSEMIAAPMPAWTEKAAGSINGSAWRQVVTSGSKPDLDVIRAFREAIAEFPSRNRFNTLSLVEYRLLNFQASIDAAMKSLELTQTERNLPGPHAADLAFLAMSYFQLGNNAEANKYREQLTEAMKLDAFKDDEDCQNFVAEVNMLFDSEKAGATSKEPAPATNDQ